MHSKLFQPTEFSFRFISMHSKLFQLTEFSFRFISMHSKLFQPTEFSFRFISMHSVIIIVVECPNIHYQNCNLAPYEMNQARFVYFDVLPDIPLLLSTF